MNLVKKYYGWGTPKDLKDLKKMFDLSIVIPCYNEEKNIQNLVGKIQEINKIIKI